MDYIRVTTWLLVLALTPPVLPAETLQDAFAYCHEAQAGEAASCHLQPCPCRAGEITLKRFDEATENRSLCACASPLAERRRIRQQAVELCGEYRRTQHQTCFVSRGDCPHGFEAIAEFSDAANNRFTACRDSRHEHHTRQIVDLRGMPGDTLLAKYEQLINHLESRLVGPPKLLPASTIDTLNGYFPGFPLKRLALMSTQALSQGCFSDCNRIFCADNGQIEEWTKPVNPPITRGLLHQIVHADRCEYEGGRDRFVINWFEHLPDDVYAQLHARQPLDADRIHFAMYMESHANNRARSLCRRLPGCRTD